METVGQGVVDRLDLRIGDHSFVGVEHALDAMGIREGPSPEGIAGGNRDQPVPRELRGRHDRPFVDPRDA